MVLTLAAALSDQHTPTSGLRGSVSSRTPSQNSNPFKTLIRLRCACLFAITKSLWSSAGRGSAANHINSTTKIHDHEVSRILVVPLSSFKHASSKSLCSPPSPLESNAVLPSPPTNLIVITRLSVCCRLVVFGSVLLLTTRTTRTRQLVLQEQRLLH